MLEVFLADQLNAFEKETIEIPLTEEQKYISRYDLHFQKEENKKTKNSGC